MEEGINILEFYGKIEITRIVDFDTNKPQLMIHIQDGNGLDHYLFLEELNLGKTKVVPYNH